MPKIQKPTVIFFDAAGTLIDLKFSVGQTYAHHAKPFGVDLNPADVQLAFRQAFSESPPLCFPNAKAPEIKMLEYQWWFGLVSQAIDQKRFASGGDFDDYFKQLFLTYAQPETWVIRDGVLELLETLSQQSIPLGIISNFDSRLYGILEGLDLARFFKKIFVSSECGFAKPDIQFFRHALNFFAVSDFRLAVHVGDSETLDIKPASALNMRAFNCTTSNFSWVKLLADIGFVRVG